MVVGGCSWLAMIVDCAIDPFLVFFFFFLDSGMYYFIVTDILFYCYVYIILLY